MALAVLCIIGFIAYWVPTLAANSNRHRNRTAIAMINLFLGWTVIGWAIALAWADTDNCELEKVWDTSQEASIQATNLTLQPAPEAFRTVAEPSRPALLDALTAPPCPEPEEISALLHR